MLKIKVSQSETKGFSEDCRGAKNEIYVSKGLRTANYGSPALQSPRQLTSNCLESQGH